MNKLKFNPLFLAIIVASTLALSSCKDDDVVNPPNPNEEELITSVELTFINLGDPSDVSIFKFADPDGEGGNSPTRTDTVKLISNGSYSLSLRFLDESSAEIENITEEIIDEATDHLVCISSSSVGVSIAPEDLDDNNLVIGLENSVSTGASELTDLLVNLKHQPGIKDGDCDKGETDVEVTFVLEVE
ncbi:hypothetical protein OAD66_03285 [Bacteroidia bacterium]|nr:hypothetical protein [Bacteroidia bacterium]